MKKLILLIIIFYSNLNHAKHVPPIFGGFWYEQGGMHASSTPDACFNHLLTYDKKYFGTAENAASEVWSNPPQRDDCSWQPIKLRKQIEWWRPEDFNGDYDDWYKIYSNPTSPVPMIASRFCNSKSGTSLDFIQKIIEPSYASCPPGTYSSFDRDTSKYGCTDNPQACMGDILGRDLDSPIIKSVGHVALGNFGSVIEALNEKPVIQDTDLKTFKTKSKFWGEKFKIDGLEPLSLDKATKIADSGSDQQLCDEVSYNPGWDWWPCQYDSTRGHKTALFRCDSFVYNAYLQGANIKIIPNFLPPASPLTLFNALEKYRYDMTLMSDYHVKPPFIKELFLEEDIKNSISKTPLDIQNLDIATYQYLVIDKNIPRKSKLFFLWNLAQENVHDEIRFKYLINCLDYLNPIELTDLLIGVLSVNRRNFREHSF